MCINATYKYPRKTTGYCHEVTYNRNGTIRAHHILRLRLCKLRANNYELASTDCRLKLVIDCYRVVMTMIR